MRHPILLVPPVLGAALFWQAAACTLTSEPFNPQEVRDAALIPTGSEEDPAAPGMSEDDDSEPMCNSSELGGCPLPVSGAGTDCNSDVDCESQVCASGRCAAASCTDGRENGSETGVDCGGSCEACSDCDGSECNPPDPTCDDGIRNQDEGDTDCGGPCTERCAAGDSCGTDDDCASGLFCPEATAECTTVSCADGARNGAELQVDCGGGICPGCAIGAPCNTNGDCVEGVCTDGECAAPTCTDGVRNGGEPSVDCGANCDESCPEGEPCSLGADCESAVCNAAGCSDGTPLCCQAPTCSDGVRNGNEPSQDCGNAACGLCPNGRPCGANAVCTSGFCQAGLCRVHPCFDGALSGNESDNDCGGNDPQCRRCARGADCRINSDCASNTCDGGTCVDCNDGDQNGGETGVDCGGTCGLCAGAGCTDDDDCATSACEQGTCCGGQLADCTRCARRLATGISCTSNGQAATNDCNAFLQCLADNLDDCETSTASECSDDEDDVCFYGSFGGEAGPGVTLAEDILEDAGCTL
jgi:hypothetical protein